MKIIRDWQTFLKDEGYIIESIDVKRNINSRGDKRWGKEVIIRNYE